MGPMQKKLTPLASLAALGALTFAPEASAIEPIRQGTFTVAAERMAGLGVWFQNGGGDAFGISLLASQNPLPFQSPRIGADYFVIDGLSIGGHLGLSHVSGGGPLGGDQTYFAVVPRVGYAFALSPSIDFWPRGGIGIVGSNGWSSGILTLEGAFLWNIVDHVALEFGPNLDVVFEAGTGLGGTVGLLARF